MTSRCTYCKEASKSFDQLVHHCIIEHPTERISFIVETTQGQRIKFKKRTFHIFGKDLPSGANGVYFNHETGKIVIPETFNSSLKSPHHKRIKLKENMCMPKQLFADIKKDPNNYLDNRQNCRPDIDTQLNQVEEEFYELELNPKEDEIASSIQEIEGDQLLVENDILKQSVAHLQKLLPQVTSHLADNDRLNDWVTFFNLIDRGDFHVNHIASQLLFDVVKFSNLGNAHGMRYSPEVKEFWSVGQSLFRGKFLRFMCGYKTLLNEKESSDDELLNESKASYINFACPDIAVLREQRRKHDVQCDKPGILDSNIDSVAATGNATTKTYALCVDGKKITSGFGRKLGEVDLFGHETSPTLSEKLNRLEVELSLIQKAIDDGTKLSEMDIENITDCSEARQEDLVQYCLDILSLLTERIKELRNLKVNRQLTLDKLTKMAGEVWQKSKYAIAISSIKTQMYTVSVLIDNMLDVNKGVGLMIAACHGKSNNYALQRTVNLQHQGNYTCLRDADAHEFQDDIPLPLVKQRSPKWFREREKAKVTGSTIHGAVGLDTLKRQKVHFDRVINGIEVEGSYRQECTSAMQHGIDNEINAVGTLCGIVLPVFSPFAMFHEEGFYKFTSGRGDTFLIVSPDGSCRLNDGVEYAVEIKCPVPGKKYTPDVHYSLPKYYVCQCLAEMAALNCARLLYLSWTTESTTVLRVDYDEELWGLISDELNDIYCGDKPIKPTKKRGAVVMIKENIDKFVVNNVHLIAEFPSCLSLPCRHDDDIIPTEDNLKCCHGQDESSHSNNLDIERAKRTTDAFLKLLTNASQCVQEAYNVLRLPAKEVIVAILSDLDRTNSVNSVQGVPVAHGLSGYSLKVDVLRSMVNEIIHTCSEKDIKIKALSTDGQFYRMCVRSEAGEPLTILQLAKDTWDRAKRVNKAEQIDMLMNLNYEKHKDMESVRMAVNSNMNADMTFSRGPLVVNGWKGINWTNMFNPRNLIQLMQNKAGSMRSTCSDGQSTDFNSMPIDAMNSLPDEICTEIDDDSVAREPPDCTDSLSNGAMTVDTVENDANDATRDMSMTPVDERTKYSIEDIQTVPDEVLDTIIGDLCLQDSNRMKPKWANLDRTKLRRLLSQDAEYTMRSFTKYELVMCCRPFKDSNAKMTTSSLETLSKSKLANSLALHFGKKTVGMPTKSPAPLRHLLKDFLSRKMGKLALNAITATRQFLETDLPAWRDRGVFCDNLLVGGSPYVWYSQPEYFNSADDYIMFFLDCHHLFVNARSYVCQYGISGLNIKKDAWVAVANCSESKDIGLNRAMVIDLIDRQSNAISQIVFSEKVEEKMIELGWENEAMFCRRIREWYRAEDEPGIPQNERLEMRMRMRQLMLTAVNVADFPPPGNSVAGMPIVMFEGMLSNIDRRIQLHAVVPHHAYNVRAPNTLAVENFFSGFQDLDPKSSGVLLADDVPHALETASYIIQMRLDPNRSFSMRTSVRRRVYPSNPLYALPEEMEYSSVNNSGLVLRERLTRLESIPIIDHPFDVAKRGKKQAKRKKGTVPDNDKPARGTMPVRQYHKADCSKILPHVRHGLPDDI